MKTINGETWCQSHLADKELHQLLEKVDADLAQEACQKGCLFCHGKLHRADFDRKPRGGPQWARRYSFCCAEEDCRRRRTPESVRFLGRRVYAGLVVVLISLMIHGLKPGRVRRIREALQIDSRTVKRWRQWWLESFVRSSFWKGARARFMPALCEPTLPLSLWLSFELGERQRLLAVLQFLRPITTPAAWKELAMRGSFQLPQRMPVAAIPAAVLKARHRYNGEQKKMKGAMSDPSGLPRSHERWARFRFSVIGPLLAAPPERGELQEQLKSLAAKKWHHPITGQRVQFGLSTIERWFYTARNEKKDPVQALRRKIRSDQGGHPALSPKVRELLTAQYHQHPNWSYQLHVDNLAVLIEKDPTLGAVPSYASVMRFMKVHGLIKRPRRGPVHSPGAQATEHRIEAREIRSYESEYVNALWHLDFHHGSLRVLLDKGRWVYPLMLGIIDDHSRLCCHAQWYLAEGAEELCHGLCQALQKRALPRALMSDNGSAMLAAETTEGLARLGIVHEKTLPYAPFQNGKQECYWNGIEGRLLPMLEGVADLTLARLNEATQAWIEMEYNRSVHSELGEAPLQRYLHHRDVGRPCPSSAELKMAFTAETSRTQRRSDGTFSLKGIRFEIPSRYHHFQRLSVRAAFWDLSLVHLVDPKTGAILCRLFPLDKRKNAQGERAAKGSALDRPTATVSPAPSSMAPLLQKLIQQYAITGLPPAYLPKQPSNTNTAHE